jgi:hypothetical protein
MTGSHSTAECCEGVRGVLLDGLKFITKFCADFVGQMTDNIIEIRKHYFRVGGVSEVGKFFCKGFPFFQDSSSSATGDS